MGSFTGILKHGGNYLIASFATSALSFISIPVYTRLLEPDEYGILSIFMGVVSLLASIMSFSTDRSVSRYYFDQIDSNDFNRFVGTTSILTVVFFVINSLILLFFAAEFGKFVGLDINTVYLIIPITALNIIGLLFEQIYGPLKKSREIAISSIVRVFLGFTFSIVFIYLLNDKKFYGQIWGQIFAGFIVSIIWIRAISQFFKLSFDFKYIKYIFLYSVPLIPYALSGVIIEQFGKIAIGTTYNHSQAGFYNLAITISSIVGIIISVTHQAWNPYYFEYMNSKNYKQLDNDFIKIFKFTIFVAFGVSCFGQEIGHFLANKEFSQALYLIPIFTVGYIFYQLAFAYLRNFGFTKKTHFMTITIFLSGISNIILNYFLIKPFGVLGAAISFVLSYILMAIIGMLLNLYVVKLHSPPLKKLILPLIFILPFYILLYFLLGYHQILFVFILKVVLFVFSALLLFWSDKEIIILTIKQFQLLDPKNEK
jgi:O-antigen/teichoic acid export membrane protein